MPAKSVSKSTKKKKDPVEEPEAAGKPSEETGDGGEGTVTNASEDGDGAPTVRGRGRGRGRGGRGGGVGKGGQAASSRKRKKSPPPTDSELVAALAPEPSPQPADLPSATAGVHSPAGGDSERPAKKPREDVAASRIEDDGFISPFPPASETERSRIIEKDSSAGDSSQVAIDPTRNPSTSSAPPVLALAPPKSRLVDDTSLLAKGGGAQQSKDLPRSTTTTSPTFPLHAPTAIPLVPPRSAASTRPEPPRYPPASPSVYPPSSSPVQPFRGPPSPLTHRPPTYHGPPGPGHVPQPAPNHPGWGYQRPPPPPAQQYRPSKAASSAELELIDRLEKAERTIKTWHGPIGLVQKQSKQIIELEQKIAEAKDHAAEQDLKLSSLERQVADLQQAGVSAAAYDGDGEDGDGDGGKGATRTRKTKGKGQPKDDDEVARIKALTNFGKRIILNLMGFTTNKGLPEPLPLINNQRVFYQTPGGYLVPDFVGTFGNNSDWRADFNKSFKKDFSAMFNGLQLSSVEAKEAFLATLEDDDIEAARSAAFASLKGSYKTQESTREAEKSKSVGDNAPGACEMVVMKKTDQASRVGSRRQYIHDELHLALPAATYPVLALPICEKVFAKKSQIVEYTESEGEGPKIPGKASAYREVSLAWESSKYRHMKNAVINPALVAHRRRKAQIPNTKARLPRTSTDLENFELLPDANTPSWMVSRGWRAKQESWSHLVVPNDEDNYVILMKYLEEKEYVDPGTDGSEAEYERRATRRAKPIAARVKKEKESVSFRSVSRAPSSDAARQDSSAWGGPSDSSGVPSPYVHTGSLPPIGHSSHASSAEPPDLRSPTTPYFPPPSGPGYRPPPSPGAPYPDSYAGYADPSYYRGPSPQSSVGHYSQHAAPPGPPPAGYSGYWGPPHDGHAPSQPAYPYPPPPQHDPYHPPPDHYPNLPRDDYSGYPPSP